MQIEGHLSQTVLNSWKLINQGFGAFISHLSDGDLQTQIALAEIGFSISLDI